MIRITGLDVSSTSTGVALPDGRLKTVAPKSADVYERMHLMCRDIARLVDRAKPELVLIEEYLAHGPRGIASIRLCETGGMVRLFLWQRSIPWVEVNISQLKRYATGNGGADKPAMIAAAKASGATPRNDDEADAYWLRALGEDNFDPFAAEARLKCLGGAASITRIAQDRASIRAATHWPRQLWEAS